MTTGWLKCDVQPGMFSTEVAVTVHSESGAVLKYFVPSDEVRDNEVRVRVKNGGKKYFVMLPTSYPHETFAVNREDLVEA